MTPLNILITSFIVTSGIMLLILIISSGADDQGLLSNNSSGKFIPGSLDNAKNGIITFFAILFVGTILIADTINARKIKKNSIIQNIKIERSVPLE